MMETITSNETDLLIDMLCNSMDLYSEDEFLEWVCAETSLPQDFLKSIHREYWLLDPLVRMGFDTKEWTTWLTELTDRHSLKTA
jgi:hypothetical protein